MAACILASRVRELLNYSPETGILTRRTRTSNRIKIGDAAGSLRPDGYLKVSLENNSYLAHRAAWAHFYGCWPTHEIDHINGVRTDNRIENLRDVSPGTNQENTRVAYKNNAGKLLGVTFQQRNNKWQAQIQIKGVPRYIGQFNSADDAHDAYLAAKRSLHQGCTI